MEENFNPVARTRANYYTPGSPVQFVCVELLKGELSGENAVCLTFKNISKVTLTALEIHFKCKGVDGIILCEDAFEYREIEVKPGESFGMDDAVFVFDEPTIGLHPLDVRTLLDVFERLVEQGATVVVIEHDLDVIANADYVVDLGPGGGASGGRIVAVGTPEQVADNPESVTGRYL